MKRHLAITAKHERPSGNGDSCTSGTNRCEVGDQSRSILKEALGAVWKERLSIFRVLHMTLRWRSPFDAKHRTRNHRPPNGMHEVTLKCLMGVIFSPSGNFLRDKSTSWNFSGCKNWKGAPGKHCTLCGTLHQKFGPSKGNGNASLWKFQLNVKFAFCWYFKWYC